VHEIVKPKVYLEVGVQHGTSLNLAKGAEVAIGIDPHPLVQPCCNQIIYRETSDRQFDDPTQLMTNVAGKVDFGFIDGLHHAEQAMRDFVNVASYLSDYGLIVVDDVLPRNNAEACRVQCPGDWTGDVWKMASFLHFHPAFQTVLVDTQPTGVLVVFGGPTGVVQGLRDREVAFVEEWADDEVVPEWMLNREDTSSPAEALTLLEGLTWRV
jgi:predicted O-methyltransferase YrrM